MTIMVSKVVYLFLVVCSSSSLVQSFLLPRTTSCRTSKSWTTHANCVQKAVLPCKDEVDEEKMQKQSSLLSTFKQQKPQQQGRTWKHLMDRFQGDFDNYHQVLQDRQKGLLPREGGGHENFHCTLIPVSKTERLAAFYFDGNPQRIFRFRYYEILQSSDAPTSGNEDESTDNNIEMKLYTLHPELEKLLRSHSQEPLLWPSLFTEFEGNNPKSTPSSSTISQKVKYLRNCEVSWSLEMDPVQHSYAVSIDEKDGIHAVMVHGQAIVNSTIIPGMKIRILDQLSLYKDVFYINDRGLDPDSGNFIYGNQRGVPYRLERVATVVNGRRQVVNQELKWTMGPAWRTENEYEERIRDIGGPSAQMNRGPPKK